MKGLALLKYCTAILLCAYIGVYVATAVHTAQMAHHGMTQGEHCMFSFDDLSLCTKQIVTYLGTPQVYIVHDLSLAVLLLTTLVFWYVVFRADRLYLRAHEDSVIPLYQMLFSQGLLHPKAP